MRLVYVDESYCRDCYYVVALLVPDTEVQALTAAMDQVVSQAAVSYNGIEPTAELHGYDLFQGKGHWEPMKRMPRARIGVYDQALRAIADHDVTVIIRGVMTSRLRDRYGDRAWHPHAIALAHLLERCDEHLKAVDDLGLVIADEPGQADQQPEYRADLRRYQNIGTRGYRPRRITQVVDTLHFAPSSASRLVQGVDLIAFLYHRIKTTSDTADARAVRANAALWQRIQPRVGHCLVLAAVDAREPHRSPVGLKAHRSCLLSIKYQRWPTVARVSVQQPTLCENPLPPGGGGVAVFRLNLEHVAWSCRG